MELLDNAEKLMEAQNQIAKLQMVVDNITKEKVARRFMDSLHCTGSFLLVSDLFYASCAAHY